MNFNFVDEDEEYDEDDEILDLSVLSDDGPDEAPVQVSGLTFEIEEEIPEKLSLTSPEVKARAKRGRRRSPAKMDYSGKLSLGWSFYCAHMKHLPTLCERGQTSGEVTCTCPCHEERGYVRPQPESLSGGDDEEFVLVLS